MTFKEKINLIRSNMPVFPSLCYVNAQRATLVAHQLGIPLLYCEGSTKIRGVTIAHAWNNLDGEIVDLSFELIRHSTIGKLKLLLKRLRPKYLAKIILDGEGVFEHRFVNMRKDWVGDPHTYGRTIRIESCAVETSDALLHSQHT